MCSCGFDSQVCRASGHVRRHLKTERESVIKIGQDKQLWGSVLLFRIVFGLDIWNVQTNSVQNVINISSTVK